jgi:hypothetical protein
MLKFKALFAASVIALASSANASIVVGPNLPGTSPHSGPTPTYNFDGGAGNPSFSGGAIFSGSTGNHAQPFGSTGGYYAVGPSDGSPGTISLASFGDIFSISLLWGSIDNYNTLEFLDSSNNVLASFAGTSIFGPADGDQTDPNTNRLVTFLLSGTDVGAFSQLRLTSTSNAFEIDNVTVNSGVPEPATWAMMLMGFGAAGAAMRRSRRKTVALAQIA